MTDRLHAHVFSLLLGIPHVVLNDRYGKLRSFHEAWTRGLGIARFAESPEAAAQIASTLLRELPAARAVPTSP